VCNRNLPSEGSSRGPANGHEHCIEVLRLKEGPHALPGFETGRRIVVDLSPEHQERLSIHNQLLDVSPFFKMRRSIFGILLSTKQNSTSCDNNQREASFPIFISVFLPSGIWT
jgi:hypothetical protein